VKIGRVYVQKNGLTEIVKKRKETRAYTPTSAAHGLINHYKVDFERLRWDVFLLTLMDAAFAVLLGSAKFACCQPRLED